VQSEIDATLAQGTELSTKWQATQSAGGEDKAKIAEVNTLLEGRDVWPSLIAEVKAAIPEPPIALVVPPVRPPAHAGRAGAGRRPRVRPASPGRRR
jgi:hypothetical protein